MMIQRRMLAVMLATFWLSFSAAIAQPPPSPYDDGPPNPSAEPKLNLPGEFPGLFGQEDNGPKVFLNARFEVEQGTSNGRLHVTAEPAEGWHIYSLTQPKGGPLPTKLNVDQTASFKLAGPFTPDHAPHIKASDVFFKDIANKKDPINEESYESAVTWSAPIELAKDVDPQSLTIVVNYDGQACKTSCVSVQEKLQAKFAGFYSLAKATGEYTPEGGNVTWKAHAEPQVVTPGGKLKLVFTATPVEPYYLYAYDKSKTQKTFNPTLIALRALPAGWQQWAPQVSSAVQTKPATTPGGSEIRYHKGPVTWTVELDVPKDATEGKIELQGVLGFQTCTDQTCDFPMGATFRANVAVGQEAKSGQALLAFEPSTYDDAEQTAAATALQVKDPAPPFSAGLLLTTLGLAWMGGLVLNVMPCVLPVIPLKLLSFVEQAGKSSAKLMAYNIVYALGTIAMFLALAVVGAIFNLSWGEHFAIPEIQVVIALFLLAMTLSLLGLWEMPMPGLIGAGEAVGSENASSVSAAFWKGFMTAIYATPCSAPFLGIALAATLSFPIVAKFLVFAAAGLGFASPYLVFGFLIAASPRMMKFIPKPGVWMEHVKQGLGFLMLLVLVLWYLPIIDTSLHIATLVAAIGVGIGCWIIGKVPPYAERRSKIIAWTGAIASIALVCWGSFTYLGPTNHKDAILPWQPYSAEALAEARAQGKSVLIDFTADWCPTCKVNYYFAIDTHNVNAAVQKNDVVVLLADWTDRNQEIKSKLEELNSASIPLLAVYPANGAAPIVLREMVSEEQVIEAIEKAGPSQTENVAGGKGRNLSYVPYSEKALQAARAEGKVVLIDFTAAWTSTARLNSVYAIDTPEVRKVVDQHQAVTMLADFTERDDQIQAKLRELGSDSIPLLAVYPAVGEPIVLRDLVTKSQVVAALEDAALRDSVSDTMTAAKVP